MSRNPLLRPVLAAVLVLALLLPSAGAAHARPSGARVPDSFEGLWQWVVSGWDSLWAKAGGDMDPNGLVNPLPSTEAGSDMDPDG